MPAVKSSRSFTLLLRIAVASARKGNGSSWFRHSCYLKMPLSFCNVIKHSLTGTLSDGFTIWTDTKHFTSVHAKQVGWECRPAASRFRLESDTVAQEHTDGISGRRWKLHRWETKLLLELACLRSPGFPANLDPIFLRWTSLFLLVHAQQCFTHCILEPLRTLLLSPLCLVAT